MAHPSTFVYLTFDYSSNTITNQHNSEFCPPYTRADFETVGSSGPYIVNAVINVALAITTTFANLLLFLAIRRITSIRLPSKLLLYTLVLTDLGNGLAVQPQFTVFLFMKAMNPSGQSMSCVLVKAFNFVSSLFSGVSMLTMTAISLSRYAALFYHLKYQQIVTTSRVSVVLGFIWSSSLFYASTWLWNWVFGKFVMMFSIAICFLVISVAYIKIYRGLRGQHGNQVQAQSNVEAQQEAGNTLNMKKYKRTASTMLLIYALFILCFVPFIFMYLTVATFNDTPLAVCIYEYSCTVVLLNSCLNPFVYSLRLPEIKAEVLKQLRRFCCRSSERETR